MMKKNSLKGWKDVFTFTFVQTLKGKTFQITFFIMLALIGLCPFFIKLWAGDAETEELTKNEITKVYLLNQTEYQNLKTQTLQENSLFSKVAVEVSKEEKEKLLEMVEKEEPTSVVFEMKEKKEEGYEFTVIRASEGKVSEKNATVLGEVLKQCFIDTQADAWGVSKEQEDLLWTQSETETNYYTVENGICVQDEEKNSISEIEYWYLYGILFVILMIDVLAGSQIATSIVSDKSSKVVEFLLTSVKPLAIIVGKVLSMLCIVVVQVISWILVAMVSNYFAGNSVGKYVPNSILSHLNFINVCAGFLVALLGIVFYATLAGLAGSTVSRMEDTSESLKVFTIANMAGAYIGMGAASSLMGVGANAFVIFACLFPLSSPFLVPGAILIGKIQGGMIIGAILLELISIVVLFWLVAKVYEVLILHQGKKMNWKEMIKLAKKQEVTTHEK